MDLKLRDRLVVVSGGARGIGAAICQLLVEEGARVVIIGRDEADNQTAIERLRRAGGKAGYLTAELGDDRQCREVVQALTEAYGPAYGLVNNAGENDRVSLSAGSAAQFARSLENNVLHYFLLAQGLLPGLISQGGAIVNIGSKVAETGQGGTSGYAAANGARNALTREWALDLLPHGVRVNAVIVAECYTPLYKSWVGSFDDPEAKLAGITRNIPLGGRMTEPAEIADMVGFLLSPRAAHTTGQLIHVDGGYVHLDRAVTANLQIHETTI